MVKRRIELTRRERELLALVPKDGRGITTTQLVEKHYPGNSERPFNARETVTSRMRAIIRKQEHRGDQPRVHKGERRGPQPIEFWLE